MDVRIPRELRNLILKSTDRRKHMKRIVLGVILLISSMALFLSACSGSSNGNDDPQEYEDVMDYYGCPNSKRIKKLNLKKRRIG